MDFRWSFPSSALGKGCASRRPIRSPLELLTSAAALAGSGRPWKRAVAAPAGARRHADPLNDAYEPLTSGSDYLKRMLQREVAGSVMGLHAERMSEEEILLLEEDVLPTNGRFIEWAEAILGDRKRLRAQKAQLQPEVA